MWSLYSNALVGVDDPKDRKQALAFITNQLLTYFVMSKAITVEESEHVQELAGGSSLFHLLVQAAVNEGILTLLARVFAADDVELRYGL